MRETPLRIDARDGAARTGRLQTAHGVVETPNFMPVATFGAVRGVSPDELRGVGAQILLSNTLHLHERPGEAVVAKLGGLQGFTGFDGPWLTDSGGYQAWSLSANARVDEEGVTFASSLDGAQRLLTPESVIEIQEALGSDIAMMLDEMVAPDPDQGGATLRVRAAMERTLRWAERARAARRKEDQLVFGIVQGGASESLRRQSARATREIGFDGYAHGGLGLGEEALRRADLVAAVNQDLPATAPRYVMGIGKPGDLVRAIATGVDLFDCVLPTRHARHGVLFTSQGLVRLKNARHREDPSPADPACDCRTCASFSRGYLSHLIRSGEALGGRLASVHNLRFYLRLMERAREAIRDGAFDALSREIRALPD